MPEAIFHCTESISFLGRKIKGAVPTEFEELSSFSLCRKAIKNVNLKTVLLSYVRHTSRISSFSVIYYLLGFAFIQSLVLPSYFFRSPVQLPNYVFFFLSLLSTTFVYTGS